MSAAAARRLANDYKRMMQNPPQGVSGAPVDPKNMFLWHCLVVGQQDSPYKNGLYRVELKFPPDYPEKPPVAKFLCKMFHPNVYADGEICVDILKAYSWKSQYDVCDIMTGVIALLLEPNPESPANGRAADMYRNNYSQFEQECWAVAQASWE